MKLKPALSFEEQAIKMLERICSMNNKYETDKHIEENIRKTV